MPMLIWVFAGRTYYFVGFVMLRRIHIFTLAATNADTSDFTEMLYIFQDLEIV